MAVKFGKKEGRVITSHKELHFWFTWGRREYYEANPSRVVKDKVRVTMQDGSGLEFIGNVRGVHFGHGELMIKTPAGKEYEIDPKLHKVEVLWPAEPPNYPHAPPEKIEEEE